MSYIKANQMKLIEIDSVDNSLDAQSIHDISFIESSKDESEESEEEKLEESYINNKFGEDDDIKAGEAIPTVSELKLSSKETYHFKRVDNFFRSQDIQNIIRMLKIIDGSHRISLRLLDWFVTRYSKQHNIVINNIVDNEDDNFAVHISYKAQLKSFKKRYFDPFRRRKKFWYSYNYDKKDQSKRFITTIGQLNFFRWAFTNGVIQYIDDNYKLVGNAMQMANKEDKKKRDKIIKYDSSDDSDDAIISKKKRAHLLQIKKPSKTNEMKIILSFD